MRKEASQNFSPGLAPESPADGLMDVRALCILVGWFQWEDTLAASTGKASSEVSCLLLRALKHNLGKEGP